MVKSKTMTTESTIATTEQVTYDSDMMSAELDKIQLNKSQTIKGILRLVICSAIGIAAFFVSVPHNGKSEIIFSIIYNAFVNMFGNFAYWILTLIVAGNFVCHIYFKYVKKGTLESPFAKIYDNDTIIHTFLYALGFIYVVLYACHINITGFQGPEIIIGDSTGGSVIPPIVLGVFGIIIVGAIFMPFLLNYGTTDASVIQSSWKGCSGCRIFFRKLFFTWCLNHKQIVEKKCLHRKRNGRYHDRIQCCKYWFCIHGNQYSQTR